MWAGGGGRRKEERSTRYVWVGEAWHRQNVNLGGGIVSANHRDLGGRNAFIVAQRGRKALLWVLPSSRGAKGPGKRCRKTLPEEGIEVRGENCGGGTRNGPIYCEFATDGGKRGLS